MLTLGVPLRKEDPITAVIGDTAAPPRYNFWFDTTEDLDHELTTTLVRANIASKDDISKVNLDIEHPFFYLSAALNNREVLMKWIREKVIPVRVIEHGDRTLIISDRASQKTKDLMRGALTGVFNKEESK